MTVAQVMQLELVEIRDLGPPGVDRLPRDSDGVREPGDSPEVLNGLGLLHRGPIVNRDLPCCQMTLTTITPAAVKLLDMAGKRKPTGPRPTEMGSRIITFMKANGITNHADFAERQLGITRQRFHAWLYNALDPERVAAKPLLLCAQLLNTNPEYLLCISDDPRPEMALNLEEAKLVQALRVLGIDDQAKLQAIADDWVARAQSAPSTSAPFRSPIPQGGKNG